MDFVVEVRKNGYTCKLCNTGVMTHETTNDHRMGKMHESNLKLVSEMSLNILSKRTKRKFLQENAVYRRINQLGLSRWRKDIKELLCDSIFDASILPAQKQDCWDAAEKMLEKYEKLERVSLLELAVGQRVACISTVPTNFAACKIFLIYEL